MCALLETIICHAWQHNSVETRPLQPFESFDVIYPKNSSVVVVVVGRLLLLLCQADAFVAVILSGPSQTVAAAAAAVAVVVVYVELSRSRRVVSRMLSCLSLHIGSKMMKSRICGGCGFWYSSSRYHVHRVYALLLLGSCNSVVLL